MSDKLNYYLTDFYMIYSMMDIQRNPDFLNFQGKQKLVWKIGDLEKSGGKITVFDWGEGKTFGWSYREVWKYDGSRNWDRTVLTKWLSTELIDEQNEKQSTSEFNYLLSLKS